MFLGAPIALDEHQARHQLTPANSWPGTGRNAARFELVKMEM
jgi:hypothetical protein